MQNQLPQESLASNYLSLKDYIARLKTELSGAKARSQLTSRDLRDARNSLGGMTITSETFDKIGIEKQGKTASEAFEKADNAHKEALNKVSEIETALNEAKGKLALNGWQVRMEAAVLEYRQALSDLTRENPALTSLESQIEEVTGKISEAQRLKGIQERAVNSACDLPALTTARANLAETTSQLGDLDQLKANLERQLPGIRERLKRIEERREQAERDAYGARLEGLQAEFLRRNQDLIGSILAAENGAGLIRGPLRNFGEITSRFVVPQPTELQERRDALAFEIGLLHLGEE